MGDGISIEIELSEAQLVAGGVFAGYVIVTMFSNRPLPPGTILATLVPLLKVGMPLGLAMLGAVPLSVGLGFALRSFGYGVERCEDHLRWWGWIGAALFFGGVPTWLPAGMTLTYLVTLLALTVCYGLIVWVYRDRERQATLGDFD